jgi:hypothetical protein
MFASLEKAFRRKDDGGFWRNQIMGAEERKIISPAVKRIGLPILFGVMIEIACDLLKYVVRYFRTSIYFDIGYGLWQELTDANVWIGVGFAILLVGNIILIWPTALRARASPVRNVGLGLW